MGLFSTKKAKIEQSKTYLVQWDDTITAKEVMDLLMFHVSMGGTPVCHCPPSKIPPSLAKFFKEKE